MTRELIIEKLRKIAVLAERGIGGEKINAKSQLEKLLEKHHISLDDLHASKPRKTNAFAYYHKWQREILFDCYHRIMCIDSFDYYRNKRRIYFEMTSLQEADLRDMYAHYKRLYGKELKRLGSAFMMKHHLYNHNQDDSNGDGKSLSKEEVAAIVRMMQGIEPSDYVSRNRSLV